MKNSNSISKFFVLLLGLLFSINQPCFPCSTFVLKDADGKYLVFGRNWDHFTSKGLIIENKRNVIKTALLMPPDQPVQWISKYGSITFNQIGKEFPYGGMNETGLVVEMMGLENTKYPQPDERPALMEIQWIQYQLDNFSTIEEVIHSNSQIRVSQALSPLHFLVCDSSGKAATIEFIDGKCVCHTGEELPIPALTNDTYGNCLDFLTAYQDFTYEEKVTHTSLESKDRFVKIARRLEDFKSGDIQPAVEYAFDILSSVGTGKVMGACTAWSVVYDIKNLQIYFKTFENRNIRIIKFSDFDFDCSVPSKILDMSQDLKGDVDDDFVEYSREKNRILIRTVLKIYKDTGFMPNITGGSVYFLVNYPETLQCK